MKLALSKTGRFLSKAEILGVGVFPPLSRGGTNCVFGKPCFCPLPTRGRFDENGENDEFAFYPLKTRVLLLGPLKTTKMTKMAGATQAKA